MKAWGDSTLQKVKVVGIQHSRLHNQDSLSATLEKGKYLAAIRDGTEKRQAEA